MEWMAIARQELFHSQRSGAVGRSQHDDIAKLVGDQLKAAEHERPHKNLAQLGVCLNQGEQLFTLQLNHFTGLAHAQAAHRPTTGDHDGFAGELARPVGHDEDLRGTRGPEGLHLAADHDEERHVVVPDFDQDLSTGDRPSTPARCDACHLCARQRRKQPFCMRRRGRSQRPLRIGSIHRSPSEVSKHPRGCHAAQATATNTPR